MIIGCFEIEKIKKGKVIIMKRQRLLRVLVLASIFTLMLSACAKKMEMTTADSIKTSASLGKADYNNSNMYSEEAFEKIESTSGFLTGEDKGSTSANSKNSINIQDKIIRTFSLDIETMDFDSLISRINSEIDRLDGYVEDSNISGKSYYDRGTRYGTIIARIPSDRVDEFVNIVGDNANVIRTQESSKNVSLEYIDIESRIKTLRIEQERLYAILEKEIKLENIITLESRLSDIQYELQSYESKLRYYDNQVEYSTVTIYIQEVEKLTPQAEYKQSVGTRIKNGLSDTVYNISEGFKDFFVWFVVNLPYLLIWGIVIAVAIVIIRRLARKQGILKLTRINKTTASLMGSENETKDNPEENTKKEK